MQACKRLKPAIATELGLELGAGRASYSPLSTLNFSCRPFRPSISDCWSARNFSSLFWTDFGSLFSSVRSRTCCNTAAMSAGLEIAAAAADGAETEKKDEDQEDPEAWAAASATSLGGSRAPARRRLPRRDPGKSSPALAEAPEAPQPPRPKARSRWKLCTLGKRVQRRPLTRWYFWIPGSPFHLLQASQASGKRSFFFSTPPRSSIPRCPFGFLIFPRPPALLPRPRDHCPRGGAT